MIQTIRGGKSLDTLTTMISRESGSESGDPAVIAIAKARSRSRARRAWLAIQGNIPVRELAAALAFAAETPGVIVTTSSGKETQ